MKELCFLTVGHAGYAPLWLYSISKAYPEASALVFLKKEGIADSLQAQAFGKVQSSKLRVIVGEFDDYKATPKYGPMLRFLLFTSQRAKKYLGGFKYFHTGDVDSIICPEVPSLVEQHLKFCKREKLSYSGMLRDWEPKRIAGRVFATREFVTKVAKVTEKYDQLVKAKGQRIFDPTPSKGADEHLMYRIIVESGFRPPPGLKPFSLAKECRAINPARCGEPGPFAPMHGLHLGFARRSIVTMRSRHAGLTECEYYRKFFTWTLDFARDPKFQELVSLMPDAAANTVRKMLVFAEEF